MAENKKKDTKYDGMSASKAKRERAKDERVAAKRAAARNRIILVAVCAAIVGLIVAYNVMQWYKEKNRTHASTDYSAMLNDDGTIQGINVTDYVKTFDVNGVKIAKAPFQIQVRHLLKGLQVDALRILSIQQRQPHGAEAQLFL